MRSLLSSLGTSLVVLAAAPVLWAQNAPAPEQITPADTQVIVLPDTGCPVQMAARRWGSAATQYAADPHGPVAVGPPTPSNGVRSMHFGPRTPQTDHGIFLSLDHANAAAITDLTVVLHGYAPQLHAQRVPASTNHPAEVQQTFHATTVRYGTDLRIDAPGVPIPQFAEVTAINFADGTSWHASKTSSCRVEVSGFLPVDSAD